MSLSFVACGALDDVSATRKNMEQMLGMMQESNDNIRDMKDIAKSTKDIVAAQGKTTAEMSQKMDEQLKITANMEKIQNERLIPVIEGQAKTTDQMSTKMDDQLTVTRNMEKAQNERLIPVIEGQAKITAEMSKKLDSQLDVMNLLKEIANETRDSTDRIYQENKTMRHLIEKQGPLTIMQALTALSNQVRDTNLENPERVAAASLIYLTIMSEKLPEVFYQLYVAQKLELCNRRAERASGDLCTDTFMIFPMHWGNTFQTEKTLVSDALTVKALKKEVSNFDDRIMGLESLPVPPLRPNVIFALALNPDFIEAFHENLVLERTHSLHAVSVDFLRFSKRFLTDAISNDAKYLAKKRTGMNTSFLTEVRRREKLVLALNNLPGIPAAPRQKELKAVIGKFLEAVALQPGPISDDDQAIIDDIRESVGVSEPKPS